MKFFRNISIITTMLVVFLHTVVSHDHHDSSVNSAIEHSKPSDLLDQIALGFHISQTDGHLENFLSGNLSLEIDHPLIAVLAVTVFGIKSVTFNPRQQIIVAQNNTFKSLNVSDFSHRGPPIS